MVDFPLSPAPSNSIRMVRFSSFFASRRAFSAALFASLSSGLADASCVEAPQPMLAPSAHTLTLTLVDEKQTDSTCRCAG